MLFRVLTSSHRLMKLVLLHISRLLGTNLARQTAEREREPVIINLCFSARRKNFLGVKERWTKGGMNRKNTVVSAFTACQEVKEIM